MAGPSPYHQHIDQLLGRSPELAAQLVARTQDALRAASPDLALAQDRSLLFQVAEALQSHRAALVEALGTHIRNEVHSSIKPANHGTDRPLDIKLEQLTLVDEAQAEQDIEISRTVQLIDLTAEWEWREFQAFSATLQGNTTLKGLPDNPFRPAVFARALSRAAHDALPLAAKERQMLLRVSGRELAELLKSFYAQACADWRQQGFKPLAYKAVKQPPSRPHPSGPDITQPGALQSLLDKLPASMQQGGHPTPRTPVPAIPGQPLTFQALHDATEAQAPSTAQPRTYTQDQVMNLLTRLFTQMHADQGVQPAIRQMIGQLQPAVMRVAGQDPLLLQSDQHPAWRLINQLASYASGYTEPDHVGLTDFLAFIQPRIQTLVPPPGPTLAQLEKTLLDIQQFIEQQSQTQLQTAPQAVAQLQEADLRLSLRPILLQQVEQQTTGIKIKPSIRDFLLGPWVDVLCQAMATGSPEDDEAQAMMATVDDLIHSLQRPRTLEAREALRQALPDLIKRLQHGMARIEMPQAEQDAVLKDLMGIHGHHLLATPKPAKPPAEPSAQELVAQMRAEMAAAPPSPDQRRHPKAVDTHIGSLPTVPMMYGDEAGAPSPTNWTDSLHKGMWCKLFMQGQWTTARLLWTSTNHQFYMFTSDKAGRMHSMTRRALERLRAEGLATSLEDRSLMQRAVDSVLQDLDS